MLKKQLPILCTHVGRRVMLLAGLMGPRHVLPMSGHVWPDQLAGLGNMASVMDVVHNG